MANNEFGDFQTPLRLAKRCLEILGVRPNSRVLEPTCGHGSFLQAASELAPASERIGLEIQEEYIKEASKWGEILTGNIFETNLSNDIAWETDGDLVVVGNPPWVTSAELNRMDSKNLPPKDNFKGAKGLDALLGASNFDVCEFIMLKVLQEFRNQPFRLGMLCKTQVARNLMHHAHQIDLPISHSELYRIDAKNWFGAAVDAGWFVIEVNPSIQPNYVTTVYDDLFFLEPAVNSRFGMVNNVLVSNVDLYEQVGVADGKSPYVWRSGMKHDASAVFELEARPSPTTKDGLPVSIEAGYIYPLVKSTAIFRGKHLDMAKWVIVPQKTFGADTAYLEREAPNLWSYLTSNAEAIDNRKSSIYRNRPRFSVFGHGDYTFAPYKIGISGLHKAPVFQLIPPINDLPVVLDDTCYFLPFDDSTEAAVVTALLTSKEAIALIESLVFWDSKRPISKRLLSRIELGKLPVGTELILSSAKNIATEAKVPFNSDAAESILETIRDSNNLVLF